MLVVDLDGTLISCTTTKIEIKNAIKECGYFGLLIGLVKNRKFTRLGAKNYVASMEVVLNYSKCINDEVLKLIQQYLTEGERVIVATGSPRLSAKRVLDSVGLNLELFTSTDVINLKGKNKLSLIREISKDGDFDYVGDSFSDFAIFREAKRSYLVKHKGSIAIGADIVGLTFEKVITPPAHIVANHVSGGNTK